eukprot:scaffold4120_cov400-Prasinococcus_capsulatus_cf.AAC.20
MGALERQRPPPVAAVGPGVCKRCVRLGVASRRPNGALIERYSTLASRTVSPLCTSRGAPRTLPTPRAAHSCARTAGGGCVVERPWPAATARPLLRAPSAPRHAQEGRGGLGCTEARFRGPATSPSS